MAAMKKQGIARTELPWHNKWTRKFSLLFRARDHEMDADNEHSLQLCHCIGSMSTYPLDQWLCCVHTRWVVGKFVCLVIPVSLSKPALTSNNLLTCIRDIPLILMAYLGWKYFKGTKFVALEDIPIRAALDEIRDNPETPEPVRKGWKGVVMKLLWE